MTYRPRIKIDESYQPKTYSGSKSTREIFENQQKDYDELMDYVLPKPEVSLKLILKKRKSKRVFKNKFKREE